MHKYISSLFHPLMPFFFFYQFSFVACYPMHALYFFFFNHRLYYLFFSSTHFVFIFLQKKQGRGIVANNCISWNKMRKINFCRRRWNSPGENSPGENLPDESQNVINLPISFFNHGLYWLFLFLCKCSFRLRTFYDMNEKMKTYSMNDTTKRRNTCLKTTKKWPLRSCFTTI